MEIVDRDLVSVLAGAGARGARSTSLLTPPDGVGFEESAWPASRRWSWWGAVGDAPPDVPRTLFFLPPRNERYR